MTDHVDLLTCRWCILIQKSVYQCSYTLYIDTHNSTYFFIDTINRSYTNKYTHTAAPAADTCTPTHHRRHIFESIIYQFDCSRTLPPFVDTSASSLGHSSRDCIWLGLVFDA
jgi:hypothetical protein